MKKSENISSSSKPIRLPELAEMPKLNKENHAIFKKKLYKIKGRAPKNIDQIFQDLHDEAFEKMDCLTCANCCKTTSPIFITKDIDRISKHFSMRPSEFVEKYLKIDEDEDYVLKSSPCAFLGEDNFCSIYDVRPKACTGYPHTDRKNQLGLFNATLTNSTICPAVFGILEKLNQIVN
jgi:hypothetical protein